MAKDEIGPLGGFAALLGVFFIMVILIAVLALVVVNALRQSPWGTFTVGMTIPIAMLMGWYMKGIRPHDVKGATAIGLVLLAAALVGGRWVDQHPVLGPALTLTGPTLAWAIILYGFAASTLPVWLLLAPRDYLSTFVKLGTVALLALGIIIMRPEIQLPAITRFVGGHGHHFELGLRGHARRDGGARRGHRRAHALRAHRRGAEPRRRHGAHLRLDAGGRGVGTLVSLRDHVRGALHPDHARRGHARRALHAPGPARARVGPARADELVPERVPDQRAGRGLVGLLPLPGRGRSAGRHQHPLAALRHLEPAPRGDRARGRDHDHHPRGAGALRLDDARAARVAARRHHDGGLAEDLRRRPGNRLPGAGRTPCRAAGSGAGTGRPARRGARADLQPPARRGRDGALHGPGRPDRRRVATGLVPRAARTGAGGGARRGHGGVMPLAAVTLAEIERIFEIQVESETPLGEWLPELERMIVRALEQPARRG